MRHQVLVATDVQVSIAPKNVCQSGARPPAVSPPAHESGPEVAHARQEVFRASPGQELGGVVTHDNGPLAGLTVIITLL